MIIDYLSFTIKSENIYDDYLQLKSYSYIAANVGINSNLSMSYDDYCLSLLNTFLCTVNESGNQAGIHAVHSSKGAFGYSKSFIILNNDNIQLGMCAYSGNSGTMMFSFTGRGCRYFYFRDVEYYLKLVSAKITRIDIAHDFYDGEFDIKYAVDAYKAGKFQKATNTTQPKALLMDDFDSGDGKTFYVGKSINGKSIRIYEKGKQLKDMESLWVRWELQLGCRDRLIPLDIFSNLSEYFVASYPVLFDILRDSKIDDSFDAVIKVSKETSKISYNHLKKYASIAYGKLISFMKNELCFSDSDIVKNLVRSGTPSRLSDRLGYTFIFENGSKFQTI